MYEYSFPEGIMWRSNDFVDLASASEVARFQFGEIVDTFVDDHDAADLIGVHGYLNRLEGNFLLHAHGADNLAPWSYVDRDEPYNLQRLVDQLDGQFNSIFLFTCNTLGQELYTTSSLLFHLSDIVNLEELQEGGHSRLYLPNIGYSDESVESRQQVYAA